MSKYRKTAPNRKLGRKPHKPRNHTSSKTVSREPKKGASGSGSRDTDRARRETGATDQSGNLWLEAEIYELDTGKYLYELGYRIKDGRTGTLRVKREKRRVLPPILSELESFTADLPEDSAAARDLIREALSTKPKKKVIEVPKTGWVDRPDVIAFVTPDCTYGDQQYKLSPNATVATTVGQL